MSIKKSTKYSGKYSSPDARKTEIDLPGVKEGPGQFQILAQAVVNTIQQPVLVLDHALQVVTANQLYCDIFQTSSPQIVSKNIDQVNSNFNNSLLFKKLSGLKHAGDHFDNIEICSKSDSKHDLLFASGRKILDTPENQLIMLTFSFGNEVDQSCREEE